MKKVRFESPKQVFRSMDELECHFPRPFIEALPPRSHAESFERVLSYSSDPVQRYENSNSSPYPTVDKMKVPESNNCQPEWHPSNDLELSMLDGSPCKPRQPAAFRPVAFNSSEENVRKENPRVLTTIQNNPVVPPNILTKDDGFFLRRDNIDKYHFGSKPLENQLNRLSLGKENNPIAKKVEIMNMAKRISPEKVACPQSPLPVSCQCYHCLKTMQNHAPVGHSPTEQQNCCGDEKFTHPINFNHCLCLPNPSCFTHCHQHAPNPHICNCERQSKSQLSSPQSSVDKKTWAIERYEQGRNCENKDLEKQSNVSKEKREPTVADLFKIIKLQNEQLQLLQEKFDKFITCTEANNKSQNMMTEKLALQSKISEPPEQHKISIGVMTSFEMVRTATVINQEIVKQSNDSSQIQCNRSHISIKEVVSSSKPVNLNFLDGIPPVEKPSPSRTENRAQDKAECYQQNVNEDNNDDKTYNEQSLYNLQVENATTPLISPDQSMFLDVKDYSDSDESVIDHSNVGWTYYNKVMTHVNGLLHDSDMPSSASAMYKNTRQQCMQMQFDKTNLSVMKRVKFGDEPQGVCQPRIHTAPAATDVENHHPQVYAAATDFLGVPQPQIYAGATDISWKMNQLAAKYLKPVQHQVSTPMNKDVNVSMATKKYFQRQNLLTGTQTKSTDGELPKFLDITALKQQPKLL